MCFKTIFLMICSPAKVLSPIEGDYSMGLAGMVSPALLPQRHDHALKCRHGPGDAGRVAASAVGTSLTMGPNQLVNPGAELGDPSLS